MAKAILHIGAIKTGSTSLQTWLYSHPDILANHGYHYSRSAGGLNHIKLIAYAIADELRSEIPLFPGAVWETPAGLEADMAKEAKDHPDRTMLFSHEGCHRFLITAQEIGRLHKLLSNFFKDIEIIIYIRRQDRVIVSSYSSILKAGGKNDDVIDEILFNEHFLDYFTSISNWADVFGETHLSVRLYDDVVRTSGSIISDYCGQLGFKPQVRETARLNRSLRPQYQEFLRQLNLHLPAARDGLRNPHRGNLETHLEKIGAGPGRMPERQRVERCYAPFRSSNEAVRRKWFPDRPLLFDENFDDYPEHSEKPDLDSEFLLSTFAILWEEVNREREQLATMASRSRLEIARLRGQATHQPQEDGAPNVADSSGNSQRQSS